MKDGLILHEVINGNEILKITKTKLKKYKLKFDEFSITLLYDTEKFMYFYGLLCALYSVFSNLAPRVVKLSIY